MQGALWALAPGTARGPLWTVCEQPRLVGVISLRAGGRVKERDIGDLPRAKAQFSFADSSGSWGAIGLRAGGLVMEQTSAISRERRPSVVNVMFIFR